MKGLIASILALFVVGYLTTTSASAMQCPTDTPVRIIQGPERGRLVYLSPQDSYRYWCRPTLLGGWQAEPVGGIPTMSYGMRPYSGYPPNCAQWPGNAMCMVRRGYVPPYGYEERGHFHY